MNDYQERITAFMRYKRMNARSFGIAIGAPPQFVSLLKELTANRIQSIVKAFPELSIEWLMTGRGNMLYGESCHPTKEVPIMPSDVVAYLREKDSAIEKKDKFIMQLNEKISEQQELITEQYERIVELTKINTHLVDVIKSNDDDALKKEIAV